MNPYEQPEAGRSEILIVEDSPTQAQKLKHILEQQKYHVRVARNGKEALELMRQHLPAMVVSDIVMPEMDGYELCRQIRNDERLTTVPVVLLTSLSDPADVVKGLECGADNFVTKPYDEPYLLTRIRYIFANWHLRELERTRMGIEVFFAGRKHFITSDRLQILNLLLSTYETAVQKNHELIKAQEELKRINEELDAFSYSVSHDLRTPLRHLTGYVDLLRECSPLLDETARGYLLKIEKTAGQMGTLINDLLSFSHMARTEMQIGEINLNQLVETVQRELEPETRGRDIVWEVGILPVVTGDGAMLLQVFANLLSNAIKYTRTRDTARIEIGCHGKTPEEVVIFIRDNGVGFSMNYADKLFGVFQRLHRQDEFEGTGIGLANVRRIITRHSGRVWAEGKTGEGATFYFTLPSPRKWMEQ